MFLVHSERIPLVDEDILLVDEQHIISVEEAEKEEEYVLLVEETILQEHVSRTRNICCSCTRQ